MTIDPAEFAAQHEELQRIMIQLTQLWIDRRAWAKLRRLVIFAPCCKRSPLLEVMDTDPPSVLVWGQLDYGHTDPTNPERKPWEGSRRGKGFPPPARLATFNERGIKPYAWCHHQRWAIPPDAVLSLRGRRDVTALADKPGHMV
jgi:hypothetical protein